MRARRVLGLTACATLLALAACTAIAGLDGDFKDGSLDGSTPGTDAISPGTDGSKADGQVAKPDGQVGDDDDATGQDASSDSAPDAETPLDATYPPEFDRARTARDASLDAAGLYCVNQVDMPPNRTRFCWDFGPAAPDDTSPFAVTIDGGSVSVDGSVGTNPRALMTQVSIPPAGAEARLRTFIPLTSGTQSGNRFDLSFSFQVASSKSYAVIAALKIGSTSYGLTVRPGQIHGASVLGDNLAVDLTHARPFDETVWYRARVSVERAAAGSWSGTIVVGGQAGELVVAQRDDVMFGNAAIPSTMVIDLGTFDTGNGSGTTQVLVDDVLLERY